MSIPEYLYDLFFEISSLERHQILIELRENSANLTSLSNKTGLNLPETRRHLSRLQKVDLIERVPSGSYALTNFGEQILETIENMVFFSKYKEYFLTHAVNEIPREYRIKIRDLLNSEYQDNVLNFIHKIESIIRNAEKQIILLVNQFPLNHLSIIMDSIERDVNIRIIEPIDRVLNPNLMALAPQESIALERLQMTPQVEQRMLKEVNILLVGSEKEALVSFPTLNGDYDYKGFRVLDNKAHQWCLELFDYYWETSPSRHKIDIQEKYTQQISDDNQTINRTVLVGRERHEYDVPALQDAIDTYDEVILKGRFNIGSATIIIKRSIVLRGEGRKDDIPETKLYKRGWDFPFTSQDFLFRIRGEDIDVTIENLHIENFNGTCIGSRQGNSLIIRKNRITLVSGLGRGLSMGNWGDHVVGITAGGDIQQSSFPGGIIIEDNYLDFALSYVRGGFISKDGQELDPGYRPDLKNHEVPICVGMNICRNVGTVIVQNNIIRNMNARGILVFDNWNTANIRINDNKISSAVFGAYPYNSPMSEVGIFVQSAWSEPRHGAKVEIRNNKIDLDKVNSCGIVVHGPAIYTEGVGKLDECLIDNNDIVLNEGLYGIQVRKSDNVSITQNSISGKTYYALQICGNRKREEINLESKYISFQDNDLDSLEIKSPDEYSDQHFGDYIFSGSDDSSKTSHVWLNKYSSNNLVKIGLNKNVIDEGKNNKIILK